MKRLEFTTRIQASRDKVWQTLWGHETYPLWTAAFHEGSTAITDWHVGSKVLFETPEGDGMYSVIDQSVPKEYMSFRHIGELKAGKELPIDERTKEWSGAMENYTLKEIVGGTELFVDVEISDQFAEMMGAAFPDALENLKMLCENGVTGDVISKLKKNSGKVAS